VEEEGEALAGTGRRHDGPLSAAAVGGDGAGPDGAEWGTTGLGGAGHTAWCRAGRSGGRVRSA
jgi:hypothetical protein